MRRRCWVSIVIVALCVAAMVGNFIISRSMKTPPAANRRVVRFRPPFPALPLPTVAPTVTPPSPATPACRRRRDAANGNSVVAPIRWLLPSQFDPDVYRERYSDLRTFDDVFLRSHYQHDGYAEGRIPFAINNVIDFVGIAMSNSRKTLEVGPRCASLIPPASQQVSYVDVVNRSANAAAAKAAGQKDASCPVIDYVAVDWDFSKGSVPRDAFDAVVVPRIDEVLDVVGLLQSIESSLVPGGYVFLVLRSGGGALSPIAALFEAHCKYVKFSFDDAPPNGGSKKSVDFSSEGAGVVSRGDVQEFEASFEKWRKLGSGGLSDAPWKFSPKSFARLVKFAEHVGLIALNVARIYPRRGTLDSWIILQKFPYSPRDTTLDANRSDHVPLLTVNAPADVQLVLGTHAQSHEAYFNTSFALSSIDTLVPPGLQHARSCGRLSRRNEAGWVLPGKVFVSGPCFDAAGNLRQCACDAQVATLDGVFFITAPSSSSINIHSVAAFPRRVRIDAVEEELVVVDRSNIYLGAFRCTDYFPSGPIDLSALLNAIKNSVTVEADGATAIKNASMRISHPEVYYAIGTILVPPGHRFESLLAAAAHYFAAGLHRRNVPWLIPRLTMGSTVHVTEMYLEMAQLLAIPTIVYEPGIVWYATRVHFFPDQHSGLSSCFQPFLKNVLWPQVKEAAQAKHLAVHKRVAFLKLVTDRPEQDVLTPQRSFVNTSKFVAFASRVQMPVYNVLPLVDKIYYANTAEEILTNWGATACIVMFPMIYRPVRIVILVHEGYKPEFPSIFVAGSSHLTPVFKDAMTHAHGIPWEMIAPGFMGRCIGVTSLDSISVDSFWERVFDANFSLSK